MWHLTLFLALLLQAPETSERVVVGLADGRQVLVDNPEFTGFIQGSSANTFLMYRQERLHGQMPTSSISRIEFGKYQRGKPFALIVTLKNGQKIDVQSEHRDFVTVKGKTATGEVFIKHPDPIATPARLSARKRDRGKDLTIQFLEFPPS
jgi:hypothetical protein